MPAASRALRAQGTQGDAAARRCQAQCRGRAVQRRRVVCACVWQQRLAEGLHTPSAKFKREMRFCRRAMVTESGEKSGRPRESHKRKNKNKNKNKRKTRSVFFSSCGRARAGGGKFNAIRHRRHPPAATRSDQTSTVLVPAVACADMSLNESGVGPSWSAPSVFRECVCVGEGGELGQLDTRGHLPDFVKYSPDFVDLSHCYDHPYLCSSTDSLRRTFATKFLVPTPLPCSVTFWGKYICGVALSSLCF